MKQSGPDALIKLRNVGRLLEPRSDCVIYGNAVGAVMPVYLNAADMDGEVLAEFNRLSNGAGRSQSGEDEARVPSPPAPGSAAAMIAELNRQNPGHEPERRVGQLRLDPTPSSSR